MSRIQFSKIPQLKFYPHINTNVRRKIAGKHMKCVGPQCSLHNVDSIKCDNMGGKGLDVKWKVSLIYRVRCDRVLKHLG